MFNNEVTNVAEDEIDFSFDTSSPTAGEYLVMIDNLKRHISTKPNAKGEISAGTVVNFCIIDGDFIGESLSNYFWLGYVQNGKIVNTGGSNRQLKALLTNIGVTNEAGSPVQLTDELVNRRMVYVTYGDVTNKTTSEVSFSYLSSRAYEEVGAMFEPEAFE